MTNEEMEEYLLQLVSSGDLLSGQVRNLLHGNLRSSHAFIPTIDNTLDQFNKLTFEIREKMNEN